MRRLKLVKPRPEPQPRGRGPTPSGERRYRYPAEEIWEVSEHRWPVGDAPHQRESATASEPRG